MIDLRSDTVTRPTEEMQHAMLKAMDDPALGDDTLFGDARVRALEEHAAALTGKEAGLFVASGTMGNVVATLSHAPRGGEFVTDEAAHMIKSESGGMSRLSGLYCAPVPSARGEMDLERLRATVRADYSRSGMPTAMICVETSHNHSGGYVPGLAYMAEVAAIARRCKVPLHVDGARLFNAAIALGVPAAKIVAEADSVTFCLSKGLSAPFGSVLLGSAAFIERARVFRRMVGGGLRQSGILAAAGLVALQTMIDRLAGDHAVAGAVWQGLRALDPAMVDAQPSGTNIVRIRVRSGTAPQWQDKLEKRGVGMRAFGPDHLRAVTNRHVSIEDVPTILTAIGEIRQEIESARQ